MSRAVSWAATVCLASAALGCNSGSGGGCPGGCSGPAIVEFLLACSPSDLAAVNVTGPCITGDAGPASYFTGDERSVLYVSSAQAGTCKVQLVFASGYTYSADVQFTQESNNVPAGCACATSVVPTQQTFHVTNPASTCQDAGSDASRD